jgi:hypothetical protein
MRAAKQDFNICQIPNEIGGKTVAPSSATMRVQFYFNFFYLPCCPFSFIAYIEKQLGTQARL